MTKDIKVRVIAGKIFAGWMGTIVNIEHQWNITYALVKFDGTDYPVRLNTNRLQKVGLYRG